MNVRQISDQEFDDDIASINSKDNDDDADDDDDQILNIRCLICFLISKFFEFSQLRLIN